MNKIYKRSIYTKKDAGNVFFASLMLPQVVGSFLYFIILFALLMMGSTESMLDNPLVIILLTLATQGSFLLVYFVYNKAFRFDFKNASKINLHVGWKNIIFSLIIGFVTLFGFQFLISYFDIVLEWLGHPASNLPLPLDNGFWLAINLFVLAIMPAISEELIFRGVIFNGLAKYGKTKAIIGSALLFALIHANIEQTLYPILFGIVLAFLVYKTKSIIPGMIAHFTNNALVITLNFLANIGVLNLSSSTKFVWAEFLISLGVAILSVLLILFLSRFLKAKTQEIIITPPDQIEQDGWQTLAITNDCNALEKAEKQSNTMLWFGVGFGILFWLLSFII